MRSKTKSVTGEENNTYGEVSLENNDTNNSPYKRRE